MEKDKNIIKVVVTGGAGFIGSHLVEQLISDGYEVHVVDNLVSGKREHVDPKAIFHEIDIRNASKLMEVFQGAECVFHMAALPSVQYSVEHPVESSMVNTIGTINVFDVARRVGIKRIIFSSSSATYGDQETLPIREDMKQSPASPYGLQKLEGELYAQLFSQLYGIEIICLRYFNVFGPRQNPEGSYASVIPRFIAQKQRGEALTIVGDGTQTRDFVHVRDVVSANIAAFKSEKFRECGGINIGSGEKHSVLEIALLVGGPSVHVSPRIEMKDTLADTKKAKELLDWSATVNLTEGIQELLT